MTIHKFSAWEEEVGAVGHDCEVCLNGDTPTPMIFTFRTMNIPPHLRYGLINKVDSEGRTYFSMGWEAGVEGNGDGISMPTSPATMAGIFEYDKVRAWLVGYIAGTYASDYGWMSAGCKLGDPEEHNVTPLDKFIQLVEATGCFPKDSLANDLFARRILETAMDSMSTDPLVGVRLMKSAVENRVIRIKVQPTFDGHPTLIARDRAVAVARYIDSLDRSIFGWFWTDTSRMEYALAVAANTRRNNVTGERRVKRVLRQNGCPNNCSCYMD